uniref:ATP synthase F0 subunit 8 n=1 Tax=Leocrates chinensis TaxID=378359 RepID=UPI0021D52B9E|nr:ATP synthase F0 subunit 8 [Leocrates chinensis]UXC96458.1 ATP synthase F0 subunit 8 [Leocrates chinensis]
MPHLSPASWLLMPVIFWLMLSTIMSILWWHQIPSIPSLKKESSLKSYTWHWSW